ncbi:hypothetical protein DRW41_16440 [Neobacillus piezotolerans]|uniref:Tetratricopeptide repeat protein n=1 Tax=Neobacillus piezotolerans TaxID=2259171 RepID=A0A3D8GMM3_9BACI|nr:hypothetical protein [Neobacillus piezotolerans]RDU35730.1 hypothetical protein DRW41_16440 [Neobacillus piezotolerans]
MVFWYLGLFMIAFLMGMLDVPSFFTFLAVALYIILSVPYIMPILWSKDPERMYAYLKKSRNLFYRFLYFYLKEDIESANQIAGKMRPGKLKDMALVMLDLKQKRYGEARKILTNIKDGVFKHYYLAVISLEEGDESGYAAHREKVTDRDYRTWLEIEELAKRGKFSEALSLVDTQISILRGIKLLSAIHYRNELVNRKDSEQEG